MDAAGILRNPMVDVFPYWKHPTLHICSIKGLPAGLLQQTETAISVNPIPRVPGVHVGVGYRLCLPLARRLDDVRRVFTQRDRLCYCCHTS